MNTSVVLQPWMNFSPWVLALGIGGVIIGLALVILCVVFLVKKFKKTPDKNPLPTKRQKRDIKSRYIGTLQAIAAQLGTDNLTPRECCEAASTCVRKFASEMTGGKYGAMTLKEIEEMSGTHGLDAAVSKCYDTEFPEVPKSDAKDAIDECIKVVESWF